MAVDLPTASPPLIVFEDEPPATDSPPLTFLAAFPMLYPGGATLTCFTLFTAAADVVVVLFAATVDAFVGAAVVVVEGY